MDSKPALLVIDVQMGFNDPSWGKRNNPSTESEIANLLALWRTHALPVVHVRHASILPGGKLRPDGPGYDYKPQALPLPGESQYTKSVNSSFIGTTLEADLRASGIRTLVLVGLTTNHCVSTTARMAGNLGFETYVVSDATATFDRRGIDRSLRPAQQVHEGALSDLNEEFATVATAAQIRSWISPVSPVLPER